LVKIHSTVSPVMMLKFSVLPCGMPLIRQSDEIRFQFNGTVSITENDPACTVNGKVMLLIEVLGMFSAVELAGFVALNIVKSKEPSPFVVSLVIFMVGGNGGGTNVSSKIHSTVSPLMMLKFSVEPCGMPLIRQSDEIRFQFNGTVSITEYDPACTVNGKVMLLIEVSGMFSAVELAGFVALNIVKSKEPSPFVVSLVIFMVGGNGGGTNIFSKIHSTVSPLIMLKFSVEPCDMPLIRQSDEIRFQLNGTVSVTEYEAACIERGAVMLLIDVSGMLTAVEFAGFVALNMVKSKEPSPPIVSAVIFIVGRPGGGIASHTGVVSNSPSP